MNNASSLNDLRARLNPTGEQRLFEFLDAIDTDSASRFRDWLGTALDPEVTAAVDLLNRASHGREFVGWWRLRDRGPISQPTRARRRRRSRSSMERAHSQAYARSANRDFTLGAAWLIGGILVTAVSYSIAANSPTGGHYLIATGAIVYGLFRVIRGLSGK